ncbi:hypothetical protein NKH77_39230 [Streptomyces sp. M19]
MTSVGYVAGIYLIVLTASAVVVVGSLRARRAPGPRRAGSGRTTCWRRPSCRAVPDRWPTP